MCCTPASAPPLLLLSHTNVTFVEKAAPLALDALALVSDADSAHFLGGSLSVQVWLNGAVEDRLGIANQGLNVGQIGLSGTNVLYGNTLLGHVQGGVFPAPLRITFTTTNTRPEAVQALFRAVTYFNASDAPSTAPRTIRMLLTDQAGATNLPVDLTLHVTPVNDAPIFTNLAPVGFPSILEDQPLSMNPGFPVLLLVGGAVIDPDGTLPSGAFIVAADQTHGSWQFSTNDGLIWLPLTKVAPSNGCALATNHLIRFAAEPDYFGSSSIAFRAWDGSAGTPGATLDTTVFTTTVAWSEAVRVGLINVNPVNDAPTLEPIANLRVLMNSSNRVVELTGITSGATNEFQTLLVTAVSSDPALLPHPTVIYRSPETTGLLELAPALHAAGTAVVSVVVLDDGGTAFGGRDRVTNHFTVVIEPLVDLGLTVTASPNPVWLGSNLLYRLCVTNHAAFDAHEVRLTNLFGGGVAFESAQASQGLVATNGATVWEVGNLPAGQGAVLMLHTRPNESGDITNCAMVGATELDLMPANNLLLSVTFVQIDSDADGLPDHYELAHGLNPEDPSDAALDFDGDGFSNLQEYLAGTDPLSAGSVFRVLSAMDTTNGFCLRFSSVAGRNYQLQGAEDLRLAAWMRIGEITPGTGEAVEVWDTTRNELKCRVYRIVLVP